MKKHAIIVLVFAALCVFTTCDLKGVIKTGGTIIVQNQYTSTTLGVTVTAPVAVTIVSGADLLNLDVASLLEDAEKIPAGGRKTYNYDKDGLYTVLALPPLPYFSEKVYLMGGKTETVTVKDK